MKTQPLILGSLVLSALVLALLLVVTPQAPKAQADMTACIGDYQLITATQVVGGDDAIHVIDNRAGRMISYRFQIAGNGGTFRSIGSENLTPK